MPLDTMRDLLIHELKDLYNAEKQLVKALPLMAKAATHPALKRAFTQHLEQTRGHVDRLEQAFKLLEVSPRGSKCDAMAGLIEEAGKMIEEDARPEVRDAGLIADAQRVEHYEIAAYGCAKAFADALEEPRVSKLLAQTLEEEAEANDALTALAESEVNPAAVNAGDEEQEPAPRRRG